MPKGSAALQEFLVSNEKFNRAYLIDVGLTNGDFVSVLYGCNLTAITYPASGGHTYYSSAYGAWQMGANTFEAAFRPKTNSFDLTAFLQTIPNGSGAGPVYYPGTTTPMMQAVAAGVFNGATVSVQVLYWPINEPFSPQTGFDMGTIPLNVGQIGNVESTGRSQVKFKCYDLLYILNRPLPPHQVQTQCRHTFTDQGCTLSQADFQTTNLAVSSSSTALYLNLIVPNWQATHAYAKGDCVVPVLNGIVYMAQNPGTSGGSEPSFPGPRGETVNDNGIVWVSVGQNIMGQYGFTQGWGQFTSGANNGQKFAVKLDNGPELNDPGPVDTEQFQLIKPMPFPVSGGDTVFLVTGCDKSTATCQGVYANLIHFGGMPYVPNPETAYF